MDPNQHIDDTLKIPDRDEIHSLPTQPTLVMDKKSLFAGEIPPDISEMQFHDGQEPIDVPLGNYVNTDLNTEPLFAIDTNRNIEEEWVSIEKICSKLFLKEIESYTGRDQQKKGYVMRTVQRRLFGEELPRGHGYKGKISTKMSVLYDELTGRQPRKRRVKSTEVDSTAVKRMNLRPQMVMVGVIGSGDYAKLIIQRLLQMQHQVITSSKDTYHNVLSDPAFAPYLSSLNANSFQLQMNLRLLCSSCEIILVAIPIESVSLPFYIKNDGIFDMVDRRHHIIDLCIEDLTTSNKVHSVATSKNIRYYDCQIFPQPSTLASFEQNQPSVFLGGEFTPCDFVYTVLYSLGKTLFSGRINQGIIYKMVISQYLIMQQQVLKEVYSTASSLGLTDPKLLGKMLSLCANPATVLERNVGFPLLEQQEQQAITIPIESLLSSIKHTFSVPSSYLPVTSIACRVGDEVSAANMEGQTDISHIWDSILEKPKNLENRK